MFTTACTTIQKQENTGAKQHGKYRPHGALGSQFDYRPGPEIAGYGKREGWIKHDRRHTAKANDVDQQDAQYSKPAHDIKAENAVTVNHGLWHVNPSFLELVFPHTD